MVIICIPHGYHMYHKWVSHANHMVSNAHHMDDGYYIPSCQFQYELLCLHQSWIHMGIPCIPHGWWVLRTFLPVSVWVTVSASKLNSPLSSFLNNLPLPWPRSSCRPTCTSKDGAFSLPYNSYRNRMVENNLVYITGLINDKESKAHITLL